MSLSALVVVVGDDENNEEEADDEDEDEETASKGGAAPLIWHTPMTASRASSNRGDRIIIIMVGAFIFVVALITASNGCVGP